MRRLDALAERLQCLAPFESMAPRTREKLLTRGSTLLEFAPGERIYVQGQQDNFVNFLVRGRVQRAVDGITRDTLDAASREPAGPLDEHAHKRDTVLALSPVTILRLNRRELERAHAPVRLDGAPENARDAAGGGPGDSMQWWTRLLRSEVFRRLPASAIQAVFQRMESVAVEAGEEVIRQGEAGEYYYVVRSGRCQVVRHGGGRAVQLATLEPGDGFGEEALVGDGPRNATVYMETAGRLMRLPKADFLELVVSPLVRGVSPKQARERVARGARWVDTRGTRSRREHVLQGAVIMPLHLLRSQVGRLDPQTRYIVCGDSVRLGMLAAFLLAAHGVKASYVHMPAASRAAGATGPGPAREEVAPAPLPEPGRKNGPTGREGVPAPAAAREEFADTATGRELADLIDELYRQRAALAAGAGRATTGGEAGSGHPDDTPSGGVAGGAGEGPVPDAGAQNLALSADRFVTGLIDDVESNLSGYLAQVFREQRGALEARAQQHCAALEQAARTQLQARAEAQEARLELAFAEKEQALADAYEKLASLANRISLQKADIQKGRQALENMLRTASRVHREVYRVGNALVSQVDHLDDFTGDIKLH